MNFVERESDVLKFWNENEIFNLLLYGYICVAFSKSGMFSNIDDEEWCKLYRYIEDFITKSLGGILLQLCKFMK